MKPSQRLKQILVPLRRLSSINPNKRDPLHPETSLYDGGSALSFLPSCEHIAGTEKFIRKSLEILSASKTPFDVTLDLEDGAAIGSESHQLDLIVALLKEGLERPERLGVRVHEVGTSYIDRELSVLSSECMGLFRYITLPKVSSVSDIDWVVSKLRVPVKIHALIETHTAINGVKEIAAHPSVEVLDFGLMDFVSEHRGAIAESNMVSPGQFEHRLISRAKTEISSAAHAFGKVPSHNVTVDLTPGAAKLDAMRARREFGFLRMWSIHPQQIAEIIEGMSPEGDESEKASTIILQAYESSWKPLKIDGRLHDRASYRYFWEVLKRAHFAGKTLPAKVTATFF